MLVELFPDAKNVGILYCSAEPNSVYQATEFGKYLDEDGISHKEYTCLLYTSKAESDDRGRAGNAMQADFATGKEKTGRGLRWVAETIVGLIYPPRCPICDRVTAPECVPCRKCAETVQLAAEPVCKRCGKPLDGERAEFCLDCGKRRHAYCQGKAVFVYQGNIRQSMYRFKYANRREYAAYYAREAAALYQDWVFKNQIEVIVPVPMYRWKKRRRGYNQAETFARALGRELGPVSYTHLPSTRKWH